MIYILFGLLGFLVGIIINALADDLPMRRNPSRPHCYNTSCNHKYGILGWSSIGRLIFYGWKCPVCGVPERWRTILVELGTIIMYAGLPLFVREWPNLIIDAFYIGILILVIVIDLEHRLILHIVTFPTTAIAIFALSWFQFGENNFLLALTGALLGFVIFYLFYLLGGWLFGPGALGFGDVTLSMTMGAMLGLHMIVPALIIGVLIGGVASLLLVATRILGRYSYMPYGQYLATGGMLVLVWGQQIVDWYFG